jgi:hypothetical protein
MQLPRGLIEAIRQRRVVLSAGAGISYNAVKVGGGLLR